MGNKEIEMAFNSIKLNKSEVLINKSCIYIVYKQYNNQIQWY